MTGQSLLDDSNSIPGSAAPGSGANSRAFILDEEYSALVRVRAQDTPDSRQTASSGSCNPADLENSSKSQPTPNESSTADPIRRCVCISCLGIGRVVEYAALNGLPCRVPDCEQTLAWHLPRNTHEKEHFSHEGKYQCKASNCKGSFNRWDDLIRHTSNKHCLNPKRYPCPEIGCKYSGDNGFPRKDKMKSHHRNEHEGKPKIFLARPAGVPQAILPVPEGQFANIGISGRVDDYGATGRENKRVRRP